MTEYVVIVNQKEKLVTTSFWRASMKLRKYEREGKNPLLSVRER